MPVYQIPQFLDSGDKILGPMNVRQFGYALAGGALSFVVYAIVGGLIPGLGIFAFLPSTPIMGLFAFLALGKYNGRDSEIYVLKFILFLQKPKQYKFRRGADAMAELDRKASKLTYENILAEWNKRVAALTSVTTFRSSFDRGPEL